MPGARIVAAYIDHGLRPRAAIAADIAAVRAQARHANAEVVVRRVKVARQGVSVEAAARRARYAELARLAQRVGADTVVTGHQRDDVGESALLALARGSGIDGVAAMRRTRPLADGIALLRPLLAYAKAQLREFVRASGVPYATDETNEDTRLRRNAARALLRDLERAIPGAGKALARSAVLLSADRALLDGLARAAHRRARTGGDRELSARALRALHPALLRRVIREAVRAATGDLRDFHFEHCEAIARALTAGRGGTFHAGRATVELSAGRLSVSADRARAGGDALREVHALDDFQMIVPRGDAAARYRNNSIELRHVTRKRAPRDAMLLEPSEFPEGTRLTIRLPREGDSCVPSGRTRPTSLARFLAKEGIPKHRRAAIPLLCRGDEIVAALGVRVMEPFAARGHRVLACVWRGSQPAKAHETEGRVPGKAARSHPNTLSSKLPDRPIRNSKR